MFRGSNGGSYGGSLHWCQSCHYTLILMRVTPTFWKYLTQTASEFWTGYCLCSLLFILSINNLCFLFLGPRGTEARRVGQNSTSDRKRLNLIFISEGNQSLDGTLIRLILDGIPSQILGYNGISLHFLWNYPQTSHFPLHHRDIPLETAKNDRN